MNSPEPFAREKCLLQVEMRGHSHFEMLPAEGVLLFSAWTKLSLNTEHLGYVSFWYTSISNYTFHFLGKCYKHAIVSYSRWECSPWLLMKFCDFPEKKGRISGVRASTETLWTLHE